MKTTSVAVIGLSNLFREALQSLLGRSRFTVVSSSATLQEGLVSFEAHRPDLAICAVAGGEDVTERIQELRECRTAVVGVRIVLLISPISGGLIRDAASAGVQALLSKEITGDVLQRSLELVMLGLQIFPAAPPDEPPPRSTAAVITFTPPPVAVGHSEPDLSAGAKPVTSIFPRSIAAPAQRSTVLSDRERQILCLLVDGASNKVIARSLEITEATVKVHLKSLLRKIQVSNRTQAAVWGLNNNEMLHDLAYTSRESAVYLESPQAVAV